MIVNAAAASNYANKSDALVYNSLNTIDFVVTFFEAFNFLILVSITNLICYTAYLLLVNFL